jgi:hypothetical protein
MADSQAEVYETIATVKQEREIFGCVYSRGRRILLGEPPAFSSSGGAGIDNIALAGPYVAYEHAVADPLKAAWTVVVRNLLSGRVVREAPVGGLTTHHGPTTKVVVTGHGAVVWIVETRSAPIPGVGNDGKLLREFAVEAADESGVRLLAASSQAIDPSSLALSGSTVYWTEAGQPHSAVLD